MTTNERLDRLERIVLDLYGAAIPETGAIITSDPEAVVKSRRRLRANCDAIWRDYLKAQGGG